MHYRIFKLICIFFTVVFLQILQAKSGIKKFTVLDEVEGWLIERKFDPVSDEIFCRASLEGYATWFGGRIRLDKNNELLIPEDLISSQIPSSLILEAVKTKLKRCRSDLLYIFN